MNKRRKEVQPFRYHEWYSFTGRAAFVSILQKKIPNKSQIFSHNVMEVQKRSILNIKDADVLWMEVQPFEFHELYLFEGRPDAFVSLPALKISFWKRILLDLIFIIFIICIISYICYIYLKGGRTPLFHFRR